MIDAVGRKIEESEEFKVKDRLRIFLKRFFPYVFLTALTLALMLLPLESGEFFGSEGDWYSQHVGAAETLRQTMLEQKTVFPQHVNIGGGSNAYDLAYYGLLRPDVLISCLLPEVPMKYIIAVYACLGSAASAGLCFAWLLRKGLSRQLAAAGGVMTASAACFFHAHHQIMFVNYIPFLIMAFIGIDVFLEKRKSLVLILSVFMICIHSFFYAPACLVVCLLYYLHCLRQRTETSEKTAVVQTGAIKNCGAAASGIAAKKLTLRAALAVMCAVGMAAVLLLPTALDILSTNKDGGSFAEEPLRAVSLSLDGLLYDAYGCGLTLAVFYGLLLALWDKKKRRISAAVLICQILPAVSLVLSGFLYARAKILIPFLPLAIWICTETFEDVRQGKQKLRLMPAVLCLIPAFFSQWSPLIIAEGSLIIIWGLFSVADGRLQERGNNDGAPRGRLEMTEAEDGATKAERLRRESGATGKYKKLFYGTGFFLMLAVPLCVSYGTNRFAEDYIKADDGRQSRFELEEISELIGDGRYRFEYLSSGYTNSNLLPSGKLNRSSIYSSVSNSTYGRFFYDVMRNPIAAKNRVALVAGDNVFFNYFMGIRYLLAKTSEIPYGYVKIAEKDGYAIAENENVLPICYGVYDLKTEEEYEKLDFPYTIAALAGSRAEELGAVWTENGIELSETVDKEAVIISFDVERRDGKETVISVENVENKLSAEDAAYPNENYNFTYIITSGKPIKTLRTDVSEGDYSVKNLKAYKAKLPQKKVVTPVFYSQHTANQVFSGSVEMEKDGWFVTSYPYKDGYHVEADGKEVEAELVNMAFMGFPLAKGKHDIEITYTAPGFWAGLIISIVSLAAAAMIIIREKKE